MPVTVKTVYTRDRLLKYNYFMAASKKVLWTIMTICTAIITFAFVICAMQNLLSFRIIYCFIAIIILDLFCFFCNFILPRFTIGKTKNLNTEIDYTFDTECLQIAAINDFVDETLTVQYSMINKAVGKNNELYLLISRTQGYIVDMTALSYEKKALILSILEDNLAPEKVKFKI